MPLGPKKNGAASAWAFARGAEHQDPYGGRRLGQSLRFRLRRRVANYAGRAFEGFDTQAVIADKGYDAGALVVCIEASGAQAVIPPRKNRLQPRSYDHDLYKDRNLVERFFSRLKQFRRIATRYEKLARNFCSMLNLVCAYIWLA